MSDAQEERARRAIEALRKPDYTFARTPNTIRQSVAEVIEDLLAALTAARLAVVPVPKGDVAEAAVRAVMADSAVCERMEQWTRGVLRDAAPVIAAAVEAKTREECAKIADTCEEQQDADHGAANTGGAAAAAAAIRAGGRREQ